MLIQTHNGKIHASECVSIGLLTNYYANKGENVKALRSRVIQEADIYVEVGTIENKLCFNNDNLEYWPESSFPLSSAGLIWKKYGKELLEMYLLQNFEDFDNHTEETLQEICNIIYFKLISEIDAKSYGIQLETENINISDIVEAINCDDTSNDEIQNDNFYRAVHLVAEIFDIKFKQIINSYFNFSKDLEKVREYDLDGDILVLEEKIPTIFKCLNTLNASIKFIIIIGENEYTIKSRRSDQKIYPIALDLFEKLSKPEDLIFSHKNCFLAKTSTLESAKEIVNISLGELEHSKIREIYERLRFSKKVNKEKIGLLGLGPASIGFATYYFYNND